MKHFQRSCSLLSIIAEIDLKITERAFCSLHAFDSGDRFPQRRKRGRGKRNDDCKWVFFKGRFFNGPGGHGKITELL